METSASSESTMPTEGCQLQARNGSSPREGGRPARHFQARKGLRPGRARSAPG
jgi:hypothetical protein